MRDFTIVLEPNPTEDLRKMVEAILTGHNVAIVGRQPSIPVDFFLKDELGEVMGGLLGNRWAGWLHVKTLVVVAQLRGRGLGRELMKRAEAHAIEHGCTDAYLDTFSFQARPFYEKLGYRVFGTLENHPAGHSRYFMTKHLDDR
jgi:GNAT superfamily N-acetyltransferase